MNNSENKTNPHDGSTLDSFLLEEAQNKIKQWEECIKGLEENDAAGGLYESSNPKHFSGNFWWVNSDYLKTLPKLNAGNVTKYNRGEFWILSETDKVYSVKDNPTTDRYMNYVMDENDFTEGW